MNGVQLDVFTVNNQRTSTNFDFSCAPALGECERGPIRIVLWCRTIANLGSSSVRKGHS